MAPTRKQPPPHNQLEGFASAIARRVFRYDMRRAHGHLELQPIAPNLLKQNFEATAPNQRWVGDTTELIVDEHSSKLYLAVILDLFARFVVGWALSARNDRHLVMKALQIAMRRRRPKPGLLFHSDQGSPYTSDDHRKLVAAHGVISSMSRRGNCYDNAAMESWFSTYKSELGERSPATARLRTRRSITSSVSTTRPAGTPRSTT